MIPACVSQKSRLNSLNRATTYSTTSMSTAESPGPLPSSEISSETSDMTDQIHIDNCTEPGTSRYDSTSERLHAPAAPAPGDGGCCRWCDLLRRWRRWWGTMPAGGRACLLRRWWWWSKDRAWRARKKANLLRFLGASSRVRSILTTTCCVFFLLSAHAWTHHIAMTIDRSSPAFLSPIPWTFRVDRLADIMRSIRSVFQTYLLLLLVGADRYRFCGGMEAAFSERKASSWRHDWQEQWSIDWLNLMPKCVWEGDRAVSSTRFPPGSDDRAHGSG
jgi:hypothetical protein